MRATARVVTPRTALDGLLPVFSFQEQHRVEMPSGTDQGAVRAAIGVRWADMPFFGTAVGLVGGRSGHRSPADEVLATLTGGGFRRLVDLPDEVVVGAIVRFSPPGAVPWGSDPAGWFREFSRPGHYRVAMAFDGHDGVLTTTTRVAVADEQSRRRFARYWALIRIPSGLIRREWLAAARRAVVASGR